MFKKNKILVSIFSFLICILLLTGCNGETNGFTITPEELENNVETEYGVTARGTLVLFIKNNNPVPVDMEFTVEYYDADGNVIQSDDFISPAIAENIETIEEFGKIPDSYDSLQLKKEVKQSIFKNYYDKISVSHHDTGESILVEVTNNSDDEIFYLDAHVAYFKDDLLLGLNGDVAALKVKPGHTAKFDIRYDYYISNDYIYDVPFNSYKVFITSAYSE